MIEDGSEEDEIDLTIGVDSAFMYYKKTPYEVYYAMEAIRVYVENGIAIPDIYKPYLGRTGELEAKGRKRQIGKHKTKYRQISQVCGVQMLRMFGYTVDRAIEVIAKKDNIKISTLKRYWRNSKYRAAKNETAEEFFRMERHEEDYPGLMKSKLKEILE